MSMPLAMNPPLKSQPQKHRLSTCHRHPSKPITGFCASCLRERLAGIDPDTHQETPVTRLDAELRRSKSYSTSTNHNASSSTSNSAAAASSSEPRRKSCDVKSRNSLSDLFCLDDKRRNGSDRRSRCLDLGLELKEEEENEIQIRVYRDLIEPNVSACEAVMDDFEEEEEGGEFKTMKEFIDLEWEKKKNGGKDFRDIIAGSFWDAASVFSKKLGKWQLKQKKKNKKEEKEKKDGGFGDGLMRRMEKPCLRKLRETQSEIGEYGFGRRSCDTDPRLSVDIARYSVDDSRYSFDEPRASWDGYLIGKGYPRLNPLVSVVEDVNLHGGNEVENLKENVDLEDGEESNPGGTAQTRDYYSDRRARRRSFDRSTSNRRVGLGEDEMKVISNAKVSPETVGLFHGAKLLVTEKELRDSNWYSLKEYHSESVDSVSKDVGSVEGGAARKGFKFKKSQRWQGLWNIWGMLQRRNESKCMDEESSIGRNAFNEQIAESWQKFSGEANRDANGTASPKLIRSYTVSAKDSTKMACSKSGVETKENSTRGREEPVLQRNRSARYSPNNLDNGLLRFYLTPLRSYGRGKSVISRLKNSHSIARNGL